MRMLSQIESFKDMSDQNTVKQHSGVERIFKCEDLYCTELCNACMMECAHALSIVPTDRILTENQINLLVSHSRCL